MRLSSKEIQAIMQVIAKNLSSCQYQLYLYGSRADDTLKGGDIDLLLLLEQAVDKPIAERFRYKILAELKAQIGDQKIDLSIFSRSQLGQDAFLDMIFDTAKPLSHFKLGV